MTKGKQILVCATFAILSTYFLFLGFAKAKVFLAPLLTAIILALMVLPLSKKMERHSIKRGYASLLNTFFMLLASLGILALLSLQVSVL